MIDGRKSVYEKYIKRTIDVVLSSVAIVVLSPIMLLLALLVKIKLGSPVIFKQKRPGKDEKIFTLYKFRTMTNWKDERGNLLPDEQRLTKFGKKLRATSLDELPELFNILKGDLSIVGPRPLLVEYLPYYTEKERARHSVRPGLSGLAQVSGRNFLTWDARLAKDVEYVRNISFLLDVKIVFMTIFQVLKQKDVAENSGEVEPNLATQRKKEDLSL